MTRLLNAGFSRLFKSFIFRICVLFMTGAGLFMTSIRYMDILTIEKNPEKYSYINLEEYNSFDEFIFMGGLYAMFAIAVFVGIFIGTEYSDGTIRNKLMIGHSRIRIYLSNLIVCISGVIIIYFSYTISLFIFGSIMLGNHYLTAKYIFSYVLLCCLSLISLTAIYILISMIIHSKSISSIAAILTVIILLLTSVTLKSHLREPEYIDDYSITVSGETIEHPKEKNPYYLTGTKREIYEFLNDFLPTSQLTMSDDLNRKNIENTALYSIIIVLLSTASGIVIFRKKDLK